MPNKISKLNQLRTASKIASILVLLLGCLVLIGWAFNISIFKSIIVGHATIKANTALCFILASLALFGLLSNRQFRNYLSGITSVTFSRGCALAIFLIALLTLSQYSFGRNLGIDELLFRDSPLSALAFEIFSLGIFFSSPDTEYMQPIVSDLHGGLLARRLLPSTIFIPLILGWVINQGQKANLYDSSFAMSLLAVSLSMIFLVLIWRVAKFFNKIDAQRRTIEAELQESEARYRFLADAIPHMVYVVDVNDKYLFANQKWQEYSGMTYHEAVAENWESLVPLEDLQRINGIWERCRTQGEVYETEFRMRRASDGEYRWLLTRAVPMRNDSGEIVEWVGTNTDIHDTKMTQEIIRKSQERLQLFLNSDVIGILFGDVYGGISVANDAFLQIIGYTRNDLEAGRLRWLDITPPEYLPLDDIYIAEAQSRGACTPYEKQYFRKDGSRVDVLVGYALIGERREESVAFILDISDRKQAEEERDRFFILSLDMLCIAGFDGYFKRTNPAFAKILGYSQEEILSTPFLHFIHPEDQESTNQQVQKLSQGENITNFENRYHCKDGSCKWINWNSTPDVKSGLIYAVGHDITSRKRIEAEIRQLNESLEERVQKRTAELEAANKELESFSYSVSHDLRAPLRHIAGFIDLLQKRLNSSSIELDDTSKRYIHIIIDTSKKAGQLIDDLLAFSRIGRTDLRYTFIDMNILLSEVKNELHLEVKNRQVIWHVEELAPVNGDPSLLRLVLRNLLENALKYSKTRAVSEITVGCYYEQQEAIFYIKDNGIGFDMRYVQKLFGVFQRLHSDPNFEGTGVGLANVQRIIHRHGGRVWAEAEVGNGATFYFSLPVEEGVGTTIRN